MAENLKKLVSNEFLRSLPEKLERWQKEYSVSQGGTFPGPPLPAAISP